MTLFGMTINETAVGILQALAVMATLYVVSQLGRFFLRMLWEALPEQAHKGVLEFRLSTLAILVLGEPGHENREETPRAAGHAV